MKRSMIEVPTQNTSRNEAVTPLENEIKPAKPSENDNWRNRKKVKFEDIGFDEEEIPENPFLGIKDVTELPMKGVSSPGTQVQSESQKLAYKFVSPVQKPGKVTKLVDKILDTEISVKAE